MEKLTDPLFYSIMLAVGLPFFIFYSRKKTWFKEKHFYIITLILAFSGLLIALTNTTKSYHLMGWWLICPLISFSLDRILKKYAERKLGRDFYLWLKWSDEIDDSINADNPHVKPLDKLISLTLLFSTIGFLLAGALIFGA